LVRLLHSFGSLVITLPCWFPFLLSFCPWFTFLNYLLVR
jgi:hypothetical protein